MSIQSTTPVSVVWLPEALGPVSVVWSPEALGFEATLCQLTSPEAKFMGALVLALLELLLFLSSSWGKKLLVWSPNSFCGYA